MRRPIPIACACLLAMLSAPLALMAPSARAAGAQGPLTEWTPACICRSGVPKQGDRITAVFRITEANKDELKRKIDGGRLGLGQYATLKGEPCDQPKLCGRSYDFKTKKYVPNTPISGPVTLRITMMANAPARRRKGARHYSLYEKWFRVGHSFRIGGKPTSRAAARATIEAANRVTVWRPVCICKSGHPKRRDQVTAIFRITDANKDAMMRKMRDGRLGLRQSARLVGSACDRPKLCGTSYDFKTKERFANTPIAGPVTIRINMLLNAPVSKPRGAKAYRLVEKRFRVGHRFSVGGKPLAR